MTPEQNDEKLVVLSRQIAGLYIEVKKQVIASEKLSPGARVPVQALNELRNAFDHYMRTEAVWRHGIKPGKGTVQDPSAYCEKNLQKALGHVYRAGYDALDVLTMNRIRQIEKYADSYQISTLHTVITDYAVRIRQPFEEAVQQCDGAKQGKDVEPEHVDLHPGFFAEYKTALKKFDSVLDVLHAYDKDLIAVEKETCMREVEAATRYRKQRNYAFVGFILAVIGIILTIVLSRCQSQ